MVLELELELEAEDEDKLELEDKLDEDDAALETGRE